MTTPAPIDLDALRGTLATVVAPWVAELEQSWVYLAHRSFSWLIVGTAMLFYRKASQTTWLEKSIVGLVFAQMFLGIVLARVGILAVAQILHIGLSSLLVSGLCLWLLASRRARSSALTSSPGPAA